jgi:hypothetical protein
VGVLRGEVDKLVDSNQQLVAMLQGAQAAATTGTVRADTLQAQLAAAHERLNALMQQSVRSAGMAASAVSDAFGAPPPTAAGFQPSSAAASRAATPGMGPSYSMPELPVARASSGGPGSDVFAPTPAQSRPEVAIFAAGWAAGQRSRAASDAAQAENEQQRWQRDATPSRPPRQHQNQAQQSRAHGDGAATPTPRDADAADRLNTTQRAAAAEDATVMAAARQLNLSHTTAAVLEDLGITLRRGDAAALHATATDLADRPAASWAERRSASATVNAAASLRGSHANGWAAQPPAPPVDASRLSMSHLGPSSNVGSGGFSASAGPGGVNSASGVWYAPGYWKLKYGGGMVQ